MKQPKKRQSAQVALRRLEKRVDELVTSQEQYTQGWAKHKCYVSAGESQAKTEAYRYVAELIRLAIVSNWRRY